MKADEGVEVQVCQGACIAFVIFDEPAEACGAGKAAFDDPPAGEQHEAPRGLGQLHDLQFDAVRTGGHGRLLAGVALIDEGDLDARAGGRLHGLGQPGDLSAIIGISGCDMQRQEVAEGIHRHVQLRTLLALGSVVAGPLAALG